MRTFSLLRRRPALLLSAVLILSGSGATFSYARQEQTPPVQTPPVQTPPVQTPPVQTPEQTTPAKTTPVAPLTETIKLSEEDTALYKKALGSIRSSKGLKIESDLSMTVEGTGLKLTINENLKIAGRVPNLYRADLAVRPPTQVAPIRFAVIGDGKKIFIHRPGTKQYAVRPARGTGDTDDTDPFETGLYFGFLVLSPGGEMANLDALRLGGGSVTVASEAVGGKDCRVFAISPTDNSFKIRIFINPGTTLVEQIEMEAKDGGNNILVKERITKQSLSAALSPTLFRFTPPTGTKKVPKLSVGDF